MEVKMGDRVTLRTGNYGGLNYLSLLEDGYDSRQGAEVIAIDHSNRYPFKVSLPMGNRWVSARDISGVLEVSDERI